RRRRAGEARRPRGGKADSLARQPATPPVAVCSDHGDLMSPSGSTAAVPAVPDQPDRDPATAGSGPAPAASPAGESALARSSRAALSDDGLLASVLPGFRPRSAQQDLSAAVATAFEDREPLLA